MGGRPRLLAGHKNSVSSDVSELNHKHKGKIKREARLQLHGTERRSRYLALVPHPTAGRSAKGPIIPQPPRAPPRACDRSGGVPAASSASLSTPPLGCLRERGRGRTVSSKSRLLGRAGPRLPEPSGQLTLSQQLGHALSPVLDPYQSSAAPRPAPPSQWPPQTQRR